MEPGGANKGESVTHSAKVQWDQHSGQYQHECGLQQTSCRNPQLWADLQRKARRSRPVRITIPQAGGGLGHGADYASPHSAGKDDSQ